MRFLKEFLTALLVTVFSMAVSAKVNVTNGDYKSAEVTGNNINIRSGAGTEYPIAYQYVGFSYDVNTGTESATKENVPPAEKGTRYWVSDAGDWWEIYTETAASHKDSKQFISKKYCQLVETDPFDMESITTPQVYVYSQKWPGYEGEIIDSNIVMTIYPGGNAVSQYWSDYGSEIAFGSINDDNTAFANLLQTIFNTDIKEGNPNAYLDLDVAFDDEEYTACLVGSIGKNNMKSFKWKGRNIKYIDLSDVTLDKWNSILGKLKASDKFDQLLHSPFVGEYYVTRDDLDKFVRIK